MSNYPDGMTTADWKYIDGDEIKECPQCGNDVFDDGNWDAECHQCGAIYPVQNEEDPDDARDRQKELENE